MLDDFENEGLIIEFYDFIKEAENFKDNIDEYCKFMKQVFLNTSCQN